MSVAIPEFLIFAAAQVGTPGPANMALMATGARYGLAASLPFVAGVVLGKQIIIWPMGFGLMQIAALAPWVFSAFKWASALYICWLAWRVANARLGDRGSARGVPGFLAGLAVHPLNPKAWAMITAGFTAFTGPATPALQATLVIAISLMGCQILLHPLWTLGGERIVGLVAGKPAERHLMRALAGLTVLSVLAVLMKGG